jgi:hypothetical protein
MFEYFHGMSQSEQRLMQTIMLATIEYVLEVGLDEACENVLRDNPDLSAYPHLLKRKVPIKRN